MRLPMSTPNIIELDHLRRSYPPSRKGSGERIAIDDLSLSLTAGQWVSLLGPNGSGKSTLLRVIATLDSPDAGHVRWFGQENANLRSVRRKMGIVFQSPSLDALLTGRENLRLQAAVAGVDRSNLNERIDTLARELNIDDRLDDRVGALSGGLARRLDLARALLSNPEILLLDEPTSGLDLNARQEFLQALALRRQRDGLTIIMSTHLMDEAERADRVVMMHEGVIVADGSPDELKTQLSGAAVLLRTNVSESNRLEKLGLNAKRSGDQAVVTFADAQDAALRQTIEELTAAGVSFSVSAPSLADIYVERTGRTLAGDEAEPAGALQAEGVAP